MTRRRARWAALVALLAGAGVTTWRVRQSTPDAPVVADGASAWATAPPTTRAASTPTSVADPSVVAPVGPAQALPALPPPGTPLADVFEELDRRAKAGDARAACRLALDGNFCRTNPLDRDSVAFFEESIARRPRTTPGDLAWIAHLEAQQTRAVRVCSGLPARWAEDNSWRYVLQSALAGDDTLAAMFAAAPPMSRVDFLERPEPWAAYRQHASTLLRRAAERGEVHAIWMLRRALSGGSGLEGMPNALPPDARLAAVDAVAMSRIATGASLREMQQAMEQARASLGPEAWADVEREGLAFARDHFAGETPRDFQQGVFRDVDARRCDALSAP